VTLAEVKMLLEFYGDAPAHIDVLLGLARNSNQRGRWDGYRASFHEWFRMFVDLEAGAEQRREVQVEVVPGILQVEPYIRTIHTEDTRGLSTAAIEASVQARLERQQILTRPDPPRAAFVLSESCLHRRVGDAEIMRAQLDYLVEVAALPNVQLQVLPFDTQTYPAGLSHPFTMLTIGAPGIASALEFVYVESHDDARYFDDKEVVRLYTDLWSRLTAVALGPAESIERIRVVAARHT
jgi:hypothetical protein